MIDSQPPIEPEEAPRPSNGHSVAEQFRRHSVALISLFIAVAGLGYNTWRNEKTEEQRNVRHAAFRVLETLGEMQQIIDSRYYYYAYYAKGAINHSADIDSRSDEAANRSREVGSRSDESSERWEAELRLRGFGSVAMARDLMNLMPQPAPAAGQALHASWLKHFHTLDDLDEKKRHTQAAREGEAAMREAVENARRAVIEVLERLE